LEAASQAAGHSLGEEIRQRLERTFEEDGYSEETRRLVGAVRELTTYVRLQTGHDWFAHPAAARVLQYAITARLSRLKPEGEAIFAPGELPTARLVAQGSDDPEAMGLGLEAVEFHRPELPRERKRQLRAQTIREIRRRRKNT
jgi:hypothetical protein